MVDVKRWLRGYSWEYVEGLTNGHLNGNMMTMIIPRYTGSPHPLPVTMRSSDRQSLFAFPDYPMIPENKRHFLYYLEQVAIEIFDSYECERQSSSCKRAFDRFESENVRSNASKGK